MTKIFLDTANLDEIDEIWKWGIVDGVTTNQKIFLKEKGVDFEMQSKEILESLPGYPVSLEGPNDFHGILEFADQVEGWRDDDNFTHQQIWSPVIKVPMLANGDGLRAVRILKSRCIKTNVTACITLNQVFLAANAGADYVSLFYNRMKDWKYSYYKRINNENHLDEEEMRELTQIYAEQTICYAQRFLEGTNTKLIIGSIRSVEDVEVLIELNPDFITIPYKILKEMPKNNMTEKTLKEFEDAWKEFESGV